MGGAICGGVISKSKFMKDPDAYMMAFVMPDNWHDKWIKCIKQGKDKEAKRLFQKYAISQI